MVNRELLQGMNITFLCLHITEVTLKQVDQSTKYKGIWIPILINLVTNGLIEKAFSDNDFAIIKLATPVTFSDRVKPICLPSLLTDYDNKVATVSGWGRTIGGGPVSDILQKVNYVCLPKQQNILFLLKNLFQFSRLI